jgi:hypothetical protein
MIGIVTSLSEARDIHTWEGVFRRMAVHYTPQFGKGATRSILLDAARLSFPPNGKEAWDFMRGEALDDHLRLVIGHLRQRSPQNRDYAEATARSGMEFSEAPPMDLNGVRSEFAHEGDTLAVFDALVRRASGQEPAEPELDKRVRDFAIGQLWRFVAKWQERLGDLPSTTLVSRSKLASGRVVLQKVADLVDAEDDKLVRTMQPRQLEQALREAGWQDAEIRTMATTLLAEGVLSRPVDSDRPLPHVVPVSSSSRPPTPPGVKWAVGGAVVLATLLISVWAWQGGLLDSLHKVTAATGPMPDLRAAVDLRRKAEQDCQALRWKECVEDLDQAKEIDPDGDRARDVANLRGRATTGLTDSADAGWPNDEVP